MQHFAYLAILLGILAGTMWLEFAARTRVLRRAGRLLLSIVPGLVVFVVWDIYAIANEHWTFDTESTTGVLLAGQLPVEELLFFLVIPLAAILTFEAVQSAHRVDASDHDAV